MNSRFGQIQLLLAVFALLVTVLPGRAFSATPNPQYSVSMNSSVPAIGKVAAGSVTTYFNVAANGGGISISPVSSSAGQFVPYNASRSSQVTISVTCSGSKCGGGPQSPLVTISATGGTGRFGQITTFVAAFGGAFTAASSGGQSTITGSGTSLTFNLAPFTGTKTFGLGMTVPVNTSGTLGNATSTYTVTVGNSTTGSAQANGAVEGRLSMSKLSDLSYGTLVLTAGVDGTATWDAASQQFALNPSNVATQIHTGPSIGSFKVFGTPGQQLNFSVPGTITMSNGGSNLPITVATTGQGTQSIAADGTFTFYVGGTINLTSTMPTGAYSTTFAVTANYQ